MISLSLEDGTGRAGDTMALGGASSVVLSVGVRSCCRFFGVSGEGVSKTQLFKS